MRAFLLLLAAACAGADIGNPSLGPSMQWFYTYGSYLDNQLRYALNFVNIHGEMEPVPGGVTMLPIHGKSGILMTAMFHSCDLFVCNFTSGASLYARKPPYDEWVLHFHNDFLRRQRAASFSRDFGTETIACVLGGEMWANVDDPAFGITTVANVSCTRDAGASWFWAEPLPAPVQDATAVVVGDQLWVVGGINPLVNGTASCGSLLRATFDPATGVPRDWQVMAAAADTPLGCRTRPTITLLESIDPYGLELASDDIKQALRTLPQLYVSGGLADSWAAGGVPTTLGAWFVADLANASTWLPLPAPQQPALRPHSDQVKGTTALWNFMFDEDKNSSSMGAGRVMVSFNSREMRMSITGGSQWFALPAVPAEPRSPGEDPDLLPLMSSPIYAAAAVVDPRTNRSALVVIGHLFIRLAYARLCETFQCGEGQYATACKAHPYVVQCGKCSSCVEGFELVSRPCANGRLLSSSRDTECARCHQCSANETVLQRCSLTTGLDTVCGAALPPASVLPPAGMPLVSEDGNAAFGAVAGAGAAVMAAALVASLWAADTHGHSHNHSHKAAAAVAAAAAADATAATSAPAASAGATVPSKVELHVASTVRRGQRHRAAQAALPVAALLFTLLLLRASQLIFIAQPARDVEAAHASMSAAARSGLATVVILSGLASLTLAFLCWHAARSRPELAADGLALARLAASWRTALILPLPLLAAALHPLAFAMSAGHLLGLSERASRLLFRASAGVAIVLDAAAFIPVSYLSWNNFLALRASDAVTLAAVLLPLVLLTLSAAVLVLLQLPSDKLTSSAPQPASPTSAHSLRARVELAKRAGDGHSTASMSGWPGVVVGLGGEGEVAVDSPLAAAAAAHHNYSHSSHGYRGESHPPLAFGDSPAASIGIGSFSGSGSETPVPLLAPRPIRVGLAYNLLHRSMGAVSADYRSAFRPAAPGSAGPASGAASTVQLQGQGHGSRSRSQEFSPPIPFANSRGSSTSGNTTAANNIVVGDVAGGDGSEWGFAESFAAPDSWRGAASRASTASGLGFVSPTATPAFSLHHHSSAGGRRHQDTYSGDMSAMPMPPMPVVREQEQERERGSRSGSGSGSGPAASSAAAVATHSDIGADAHADASAANAAVGMNEDDSADGSGAAYSYYSSSVGCLSPSPSMAPVALSAPADDDAAAPPSVAVTAVPAAAAAAAAAPPPAAPPARTLHRGLSGRGGGGGGGSGGAFFSPDPVAGSL